MYVTLPFLLLLLDYWPLQRVNLAATEPGPNSATTPPELLHPTAPGKWLLLEKLPFLVFTALFGCVAYWAQDSGGAVSSLDTLPLWLRIENAVLVYGLYLLKMFWPQKLAIFYPHPATTISHTAVIVSGVCLVAITTYAMWRVRKQPYLMVGWLWYLGTLVPVIGLVQLGSQQMADRYTYFSLIGIFVAVIWLIPDKAVETIKGRLFVSALATLILATSAFLAWRQTAYWKNSFILLQHAIDVTDFNTLAQENLSFAHYNLGNAFFRANRIAESIPPLKRALSLRPQASEAHYSLGVSYHVLGNLEEARRHLEQAATLQPNDPPTHRFLGCNHFEDPSRISGRHLPRTKWTPCPTPH